MSDKRDRAINPMLFHDLRININVFWPFNFQKRYVKRKLKFGEQLFQTKLVSHLSTRRFAAVLLCKFTNIKTSNTKNLWDEGSFIFFPSVALAGDENKK